MDYFWLAVTVIWLSGLVFAWHVVNLRHGRAIPPGRDRPSLPSQHPGHGYPTAEELLRQRFVAGEITTEEYERLLEVLLRHPLPARPQGAQPQPFPEPRQMRPISPRQRDTAEIRVRVELVKRAAAAGIAAMMGYLALLLAQHGFNYEEGGLNATLLTLATALGALVAAARALIGGRLRI